MRQREVPSQTQLPIYFRDFRENEREKGGSNALNVLPQFIDFNFQPMICVHSILSQSIDRSIGLH